MTVLYVLIIDFPKFINSDRDGFLCQSWSTMSKFITLSLRLSRIEFIQVWDSAESYAASSQTKQNLIEYYEQKFFNA